MSHTRPKERKSILAIFLGFLPKLLRKGICVLDDVAFLFTETGPLGLFLLVAAGYVIFSVELYNAIDGFYKLHNGKKISLTLWEKIKSCFAQNPQNESVELQEFPQCDDDEYFEKLENNLYKLGFAIAGLTITSGILAFTLCVLLPFATVSSIFVPGMVLVIETFELWQAMKGHAYAKPEDEEKAKSKLCFSAISFWTSVAIVSLATLSVLCTLGVLSFGMIPTYILIAVVVSAVLIKGYELGCKIYREYQEYKECEGSLQETDTDNNDLSLNQGFSPESSPESSMESLQNIEHDNTKPAELVTEGDAAINWKKQSTSPVMHGQDRNILFNADDKVQASVENDYAYPEKCCVLF